ncbi:MAG: hypothetical protein DPW09_22950 [Anaerolineae bacterium]|nr:hypothetical protein [Anaerolineae bacterium]
MQSNYFDNVKAKIAPFDTPFTSFRATQDAILAQIRAFSAPWYYEKWAEPRRILSRPSVVQAVSKGAAMQL